MPGYWRKPLSLMYDHNYRYGTGLYSGALDDTERRYRHALFRSHLSSDRPFYGSYLSYLTPSSTYWPTSTKSGPTKKTYFYYDIPYYSYTSPYSSYTSPYSYYTSPYSSYISPYSYYTRLHYPSTYYSYSRPYYSAYRPYRSSYYHYPYSSYYSPYLDSDLYDLKRSRSDSNLRRSYSMDDLSYKTVDDYWMPLSSYLYRSPSAIDLTDSDLKSKKRWRELDDLEWQLKSGKTMDMYESSLWADKWRNPKATLSRWVY